MRCPEAGVTSLALNCSEDRKTIASCAWSRFNVPSMTSHMSSLQKVTCLAKAGRAHDSWHVCGMFAVAAGIPTLATASCVTVAIARPQSMIGYSVFNCHMYGCKVQVADLSFLTRALGAAGRDSRYLWSNVWSDALAESGSGRLKLTSLFNATYGLHLFCSISPYISVAKQHGCSSRAKQHGCSSRLKLTSLFNVTYGVHLFCSISPYISLAKSMVVHQDKADYLTRGKS
jgi:hypothetical protein